MLCSPHTLLTSHTSSLLLQTIRIRPHLRRRALRMRLAPMGQRILLHHLPRMLRTLVGIPREAARLEQMISTFQRHGGGLGEEEPDDGDDARVGRHEDEVGLPADGGDGDGRDLHDDEVADPEGGGGEGGAFLADAEGADFGGVEPGGLFCSSLARHS